MFTGIFVSAGLLVAGLVVARFAGKGDMPRRRFADPYSDATAARRELPIEPDGRTIADGYTHGTR